MGDVTPSGPIEFGDRIIGPPASHVIETEVKGDVSLYNAKDERVLVLNRTASDVWLLCDGTLDLGRIIELLASAYQADAADIGADVESTIRQFVDEGFLPTP